MKRRLLFIGLGRLGSSLLTVATNLARADSNVSLITQELIGTWKLVSYETRDAEEKLLTAAPWHYTDGLLVYDQAGNMAVQLVNHTCLSFSKSVKPAKIEEMKITNSGYLAYFGNYTVNEEKGIVIHHIKASNKNNNTAQVRYFELKDDQLVLTKISEVPKQNRLISRISWERVKVNNADNIAQLPRPTS